MNLKTKDKQRNIKSTAEELQVRARIVEEFMALILRNWQVSNTGRLLQECSDKQERLAIVEHSVGRAKTNILITRISQSAATLPIVIK